MKAEKLRTSLAGLLLSFLAGFGGVGCLLTAFDLNLADIPALWIICGVAAAVSAVCFCFKWGTAAVLCLLAVWAGYLWHRGEAGQQILQLLYRISYIYNKAYECGVLRFVDTPWDAGHADLPLQIIGCTVAVVVCHSVSRGRRTWPAVTIALAPLIPCLVVTNTAPDAWCVFSLLLGVVLLLLTASVRRRDVAEGARLLWLLVLPVAAGLLLTFRMIPKEGYVNRAEETRERILGWVESLPEKLEDTTREIASAVQISDDETVNLKTLGRQSSLAYPVMEVTAQWNGAVYLRGQDYDSYTGTGWTASRHRSEEFTYAGEQASSVDITTRSGRDNRFLPYYPAQAETLVGGSAANSGKHKSYRVSRTVLPDNWRTLVRERAEGRWESEVVFTSVLEATGYLDAYRYLLLPEETKKEARVILETVLEGQTTATAKADAIAAYVRASAKYDRDTDRMPSDEEDFALWFLTESDTGYCVHFATAAVVLLRAADVPARYVTGYLAHCTPGETVTVTADTAHAWAEYYEAQLACWIPLEATPPEGLPAAGTTVQTEAPSQQTLPPQEPPEEPETQMTTPLPEDVPVQIPVPGGQQQPQKIVWFGWLWLPAAVFAVELQRLLRIALRRRRYGTGANDRALGCWQEIVLLARLRRKNPPRELEALAQKAKYSQHTLTEEELAKMDAYIADSVDQLKQEPWYLRLLCRYVFAAW